MPLTSMTRFGERIDQGAVASFRCAACGEMAGIVKVARAGTTVDMGPPLGREAYDRDAIVGITSSARPVSSPMPQPWMQSRSALNKSHFPMINVVKAAGQLLAP